MMDVDILAKQRASRAKALLSEMLDGWERQHKDSRALSAWKAIQAASNGRLRRDAPAEHEQWGLPDNDQKISIPFTHLAARALTTANSPYLVEERTTLMRLPLVGSGLAQAGANFITGVAKDTVVPHVGTKPPFTWQPAETDALVTDSTMQISQTTASAKRGGISVIASRLLTLQANSFPETIDRLLIQLGNDAIDSGALNGSGADGAPQGLLNGPNIVAVSGASMNVSGLSTMEENAVAADANDSGLTWMASTDTRRILRQRELSTGGGSIWPGATLLGHRAVVTSKMPAASLLVGDFSNVDILLFGNGVEVLVDPFSSFRTGQITFQLSVAMDLALNHSASFRKSTTIT